MLRVKKKHGSRWRLDTQKKLAVGFTVQDWSANSRRSVTILKVERDEAGNEVLIDREGKKAITNDEGDIVGYED